MQARSFLQSPKLDKVQNGFWRLPKKFTYPVDPMQDIICDIHECRIYIYATLGSVVCENTHSFMTRTLDSYMGLASLRRVITLVLSRTLDHPFWYFSSLGFLFVVSSKGRYGGFGRCLQLIHTYSAFFNCCSASQLCRWKGKLFTILCCVAECWVHEIDPKLTTPDVSVRLQLLEAQVPFLSPVQILLNLWILD
jgi:hypothetical protein